MSLWSFIVKDFRTGICNKFEYNDFVSLAAGDEFTDPYETAQKLFLVQTENKDIIDGFLHIEAITIYSRVDRGSEYRASILIEKPFTLETMLDTPQNIVIAHIKRRADAILRLLSDVVYRPFRIKKRKYSLLDVQLYCIEHSNTVVEVTDAVTKKVINIKCSAAKPSIDLFREIEQQLR